MSFIDHFSIIEDPRKDINVKYDFIDILFLTVSAVVSGAEGWQDIEDFGHDKIDWLRLHRLFKQGIPVDDTIARIIRAISPKQFNRKQLINRIIPPSITFTYDHFNYLRRSPCDEHHNNGLHFLKSKVKVIYQ